VPKQFKQITLDPKKCRVQIEEFGALLKSKAALSEKDDLQPFFKNRPQVSAFIGSYMRDIGPATDYAFEYPTAISRQTWSSGTSPVGGSASSNSRMAAQTAFSRHQRVNSRLNGAGDLSMVFPR
jgi:hypothetical protein